MQPITKNNCDFPTLRASGCLYVDKTAWLYRMAVDPECNRAAGKPVWAVGLTFDGKTRQFKGGVAEPVELNRGHSHEST